MLVIHIQLYSILREKLPEEAKGRADLQFELGSTLTDLLGELGISRRVVISMNDEHEKIFSSISGG
jgi:sulfur carrier protein ThiS